MPDLILSPIPVRICGKCGTADRYTDGHCKVCTRLATKNRLPANREKLNAKAAAYRASHPEYAKAYRLKNKEKQKVLRVVYVAENRDQINASRRIGRAKKVDQYRAASQIWRTANRLRLNAYQLAFRIKKPMSEASKQRQRVTAAVWTKLNPESVRTRNLNRRARKKEVGGRLSNGLSIKLFSLQKGLCPCCKQPLGKDFHMDHIIPLALFGTNTDDNMQLLRKTCNLHKSAKDPIDYMQSKGFLL